MRWGWNCGEGKGSRGGWEQPLLSGSHLFSHEPDGSINALFSYSNTNLCICDFVQETFTLDIKIQNLDIYSYIMWGGGGRRGSLNNWHEVSETWTTVGLNKR